MSQINNRMCREGQRNTVLENKKDMKKININEKRDTRNNTK